MGAPRLGRKRGGGAFALLSVFAMVAMACAGIIGFDDQTAQAQMRSSEFSLPFGISCPGVATDGEGNVWLLGGDLDGGTFTNTVIHVDLNTETVEYSNSFYALRDLGTAYLDGNIYTFGALDDGFGCSGQLIRYDTVADSSTVMRNMVTNVYGTAAATDGNLIYVFGGYDEFNGTNSNVIWQYDPETNLLLRPAGKPVLPDGIAYSSAVWTGSEFLIFGGEANLEPYLTRVIVYDPDTRSAYFETKFGYGGDYDVRMAYGVSKAPSVVIDGTVYQYGGNYYGNPTPSIQKYVPSSKTSMMVADQMPSSVYGAAAVSYNGRAYIFGGNNYGTMLSTISVHVPADLTMTETMSYKHLMPTSSTLGMMTANSDAGPVYAMGGWSGASASASVYRYDPVSDQFALEQASGLMTATFEAACEDYSGSFYIFGGNNSVAPITTIQKYTPPSTKASAGSLPVATMGFGAMAYGDRIHLLGGITSTGPTSNIYRYNPAFSSVEGIIGSLPYAVGYYGYANDGKYSYLVGGKIAGGYSDDIIVYDPSNPGASQIYWNILPYPIWRCTAAYGDDGFVHIFGGRTSVAPYELSTHFIFDPATGVLDISGAPLPAPSRGASVVAGSGSICIFGGRTGGSYSQSILTCSNRPRGADGYSSIGERFLEDAFWGEGFSYAGAAYHRGTDSTYIFGGLNDNYGTMNTIYRMTGDNPKPVLVGTMPIDLQAPAAVAVGDQIYVFGGYASALGDYSNKIFVFDVGSGAMVDTGKFLPAKAFGIAAVTDGTNVYLVGGRSGTYLQTINTWNPVSGSVVNTATMPQGLCFAVAGYANGYVFVAGGAASTALGITNAVYRHTVGTTTVTSVGTLPFAVGYARGGVQDGRLVIAGGSTKWGASDRVVFVDLATYSARFADFRMAVACSSFSWVPESDWAYGGYTDEGYPLDYPVSFSLCLDELDREASGTTLVRTMGMTISYNAVGYNGQYVYSIGGIANAGTVSNPSIYRFDPATSYSYAWAGSVTYGAVASAATAYDDTTGRLYLSGGYYSSTVRKGCNYITSAGAVVNVSSFMTQSRFGHGLMCRDGNVYAVGGQTVRSPVSFTSRVDVLPAGSSVWAYSSDLRVSSASTVATGNFGYASDGSCIYLFGGQTGTGTRTSAIYRYDPYTKNTTRMTAVLPSARSHLSAVYDPDQNLFILMGGLDSSGVYLSDVLVYDPETDTLWRSGNTLPLPLASMGATFDGPLIIGGLTTGAVRQPGVYAIDYEKDGPTADDINTGPGGGGIVIQADPEPPQVYSYSLKDSATLHESMNLQIEPGHEHFFEVEVGKDGVYFSDVDSLDVYGWFDYGSEASSYNPLGAKNANFHFRYTNTTGMGTFTKVYPPAPDITGFWGTERMMPVGDPERGNRMRLRFYFTPSVFMRWADGTGGLVPPTGGDSSNPANGYNDLASWNVIFDVGDSAAIPQRDYAYDEFGVYKHQEITISGGDPSVVATPGGGLTLMDTSNPGDFAYMDTRINCPFRLNVNVTNLESGVDQIDAAWHLAVSGGDLAGVNYFTGAFYQYRIYVRGTDGGSWITVDSMPVSGYYQTAINWYADIPTGIAEGTYTGYITYRMETASDPMASGAANHPPYNPTSISPADGMFITPNPGAYTLEVYAEDADLDLCTVYFYDADTDALIGSDYIGAAPAWAGVSMATNPNTTYRWYVVIDDGEEQMRSSVWEFSTGP